VERLGGADRYEVAIRASKAAFPGGADVVYLASGATFADALAGSAAAGTDGGPVLLVQRDSASQGVLDELVRLSPGTIIILGGTASISAELEQSLQYLPATVERVDGDDRYEVTTSLARLTFGTTSDMIYVASGQTFPDALSAGAAAGSWNVPVLLTGKDGLPEPVLALLRDEMMLEDIIVVGGPSTISEAVVEQLGQFGDVTRIGGTDRYDVSAATSAQAFCASSTTVFVASGRVFPDALSGSAAAIAMGAPVLLVTPDAIPAPVLAELDRLRPQQIKVLGGPSTISDSVMVKLWEHVTAPR
jgi:putative cell wall-binding protein